MVLTPFWTWYQSYTPTLPNLYWDVNTREQQLKLMCDAIDALGAYADELGKGVNANVSKLEELEARFDAFVASGFDDYYRAQIKAWIADNLKYIYQQTITHVFFGVSTDGHLIAYIPTSWAEIAFSTGYDYSLDTYGRLILRWRADAPYSDVDQTPEVVRYLTPTVPDPSAVGQTVTTLDGVAWSLLDAGADGQVMTLADGVPSWADVPEEMPVAVAGAIIAGTSNGWAVLEAGEAGQVLTVADGAPAWADVPDELPEAAAGALLLGTSDGWSVLDAPDAAATLAYDGSDVEWSTRASGNTLIGSVTKSAIASVTDAWPSKLLGLTAYGNSTQASTPTPAAPVAIKSVAGASVVTAGKNLFDTSTAQIKSYIKITDGGVATSNGWSASDFIPVVPGEPYVLSGITNVWSGAAGQVFYKPDKTFLSYVSAQTQTFTAPEGAAWVRLSVSTESLGAIQFEHGSAATAYAAYVAGGTYPLTLTDSDGVTHKLRSLPDGTADMLVLAEDGTGVLTQHVLYETVTSGNLLQASSSVSGAFITRIHQFDATFTIDDATATMSDKLQAVESTAALLNADSGYTLNAYNQYLRIIFKPPSADNVTTTAEAEAWLASNAPTIYFPDYDASPTTYTIPAIAMPSLPATVSNAWLSATDEDSAAIAASVAIEYERDVTEVIADLESRISTLEG